MLICRNCNMEIMATVYDKCQLCGNQLEEVDDEDD